jgi:xylulokinase
VLLGIDVGTSSTKVVVIDEAGRTVSSATVAYDTDRPHDGWSEQPPSRWWQAAAAAIPKALVSGGVPASEIHAIGLSGQMHGSVFLDRASLDRATAGRGGAVGAVEAVRPAILWNDQRTAEQCIQIERQIGGPAELVMAVGNRALTGFTLPKLLWLREHEPSAFHRVAAVILPKDFVRLQLTGTLGTDVGDASGTLLLDPDRRVWSRHICEAVGIDSGLLPPLSEAAEVVGAVTPWAAGVTGLVAGTPVVAGTGDNQAGAVGAGVVRPGMALATLGTSGVIYVHSDRPRRDLQSDPLPPLPPVPAVPPPPLGRVHTMCAADGQAGRPGAWCITGCMLSAAGSLQWAREVIAPEASFETLMAEAGRIPRGCEGLVFLPHLSGERCPYPDPLARGAWLGLRAQHTRGHLVRAVVEGVTFTMGQMLELVRGLPAHVDRVRLGGGGNKSAFWRQLQADVYGLPVATVNNDEGPAFGAAVLAGVGVNTWPTVAAACEATIHESIVHEPDPESVEVYRSLRRVFDPLYSQLRDGMHALSKSQQRVGG